MCLNNGLTSGDCFVVWYDFNNPSIYPNSATTASTIFSLVTWSGATNTGYTFNTIGLTGIDNGLVPYVKDPTDPTNQNLINTLTGSTLAIMTLISGSTDEYIYPTERIIDPTFTIGDYVQFCGGFYQGYYKIDGSTYEVLPTRVNYGWAAEFWLNPQDICSSGTTGTTLNDKYPDNKGLFFYMGTRAENKFWNQFAGNDTGCTSGCTTSGCASGFTGTVSPFCTVLKEPDITIIGDYGFGIPLDPPQVEIELITNNFLIYGRAFNGAPELLSGATDTILLSAVTNVSFGVPISYEEALDYGYSVYPSYPCDMISDNGLGTYLAATYDGNGVPSANFTRVITDYRNPFLIYGRGMSGQTQCRCAGPQDGLGQDTVYTYSGNSALQGYVDYNLDIIDNALGFRIKDDGSIGYRMLIATGTCYTATTGERLYASGITIQEEYSQPNMVKPNEWQYVVIRYVTNYLDDCALEYSPQRKGKLMFYVNARLKFIVDEFPEFMARRLDEYKAKQVGVPFNLSIGGGSQGLIDSQTFDGLDIEDRGLPIETNFGGSFIGGISQFKFNICDLNYCNIQYNYVTNASRYGVQDTYLILTEDDLFLLQQNGYGLLWD